MLLALQCEVGLGELWVRDVVVLIVHIRLIHVLFENVLQIEIIIWQLKGLFKRNGNACQRDVVSIKVIMRIQDS